jgi:hypothetical protein
MRLDGLLRNFAPLYVLQDCSSFWHVTLLKIQWNVCQLPLFGVKGYLVSINVSTTEHYMLQEVLQIFLPMVSWISLCSPLPWNYADITVAILTLPVYNVWKLKMPKGRKIAVIGIFLLGTLVIVTGIVRLIYVIDAFAALEQSATADGTCKHSDNPIQS